jgi:gliding motility associated protien GldN
MLKNTYIVLLLGLLCHMELKAQYGGQGDMKCDLIEHSVPTPWGPMREGDVNFSKRVVRIIDLREKQNQVMMHPKNALTVILYEAIKNKKLIPYKNDSCTSIYTPEKILTLGIDTQFIDNPDPRNPENTITDTVITPFNPLKQIYKLRIVEDWYYDKKHSSFAIKILLVAPVYKLIIGGIDLGDQDLCVLRYFYNNPAKTNDVRNILAKKCVFNRQNNAAMMSFDAFFEGRYFSSYVIKVSNQFDVYIKDQAEYRDNGKGAILENQFQQDELMRREHDEYDN